MSSLSLIFLVFCFFSGIKFEFSSFESSLPLIFTLPPLDAASPYPSEFTVMSPLKLVSMKLDEFMAFPDVMKP